MRFVTSRALAPLLLLAVACSGASSQGEPAQDALSQVPVSAVELPEARVAHEIKALLTDAQPSPERLNRLASVTRAQLKRSNRYFEADQSDAGMQTTMGALYLLSSGEQRPEMFAGSEGTLLYAAEHVSRLGDEGRAKAFYQLADQQLSGGPLKDEVQGHLAALAAWQASSYELGSMQATSARHRSAINEALIRPSKQNLDMAIRSSVDWLNRALVEGRKDEPTNYFEYDERLEAQRAVMTAALSLAALYVRDGDVGGALSALEVEPIASASSDKLVARLEAALEGDAEAWADLFGLFESAGDSENGALSRPVSRGASFGAAVALYRLEPGELRAAIPLATLLVEHGMADVAPLVLTDVLDAQSDPREVDWVLRLVFGALSRAEQLDDIVLARRVFDNAQPLIERAATHERSSEDSPAATDFYHAMGALEARAGHLDRARPHLEHSAQLSPSRGVLRLLSAIDRQRGDVAAALRSVQGIRALARAENDLLGEAYALVMAYELQREVNQFDQAKASLDEALAGALAARQVARTGSEIGSAENLLADVLEHYGQLAAAERASLRAYEASQHDLGRLTMTLLDASRRALTHDDLSAGRATMRRALEANLDDKDLVYAALWTQLLQVKNGAPSDGSVEEALIRIEASGGWIGTLKDWGRGAIDDTELVRRAHGPVQKTEADFYVAMSEYARGKEGALSKLEAVAKSPAVELIEVRIARDVTALARGQVRPPLPSGVDLP